MTGDYRSKVRRGRFESGPAVAVVRPGPLLTLRTLQIQRDSAPR